MLTDDGNLDLYGGGDGLHCESLRDPKQMVIWMFIVVEMAYTGGGNGLHGESLRDPKRREETLILMWER